MLFNQLQQMQDQISRQQGVIEELQNQVSRMKQESLERYQDLDRRIGNGVAPAATPENSPAGGDLNAPVQPPAQVRERLPLKPRQQAANPLIRPRKNCITMQPST